LGVLLNDGRQFNYKVFAWQRVEDVRVKVEKDLGDANCVIDEIKFHGNPIQTSSQLDTIGVKDKDYIFMHVKNVPKEEYGIKNYIVDYGGVAVIVGLFSVSVIIGYNYQNEIELHNFYK
jgi:hypothetical protein